MPTRPRRNPRWSRRRGAGRKSQVVTINGVDVTEQFLRGAQRTLEIAKSLGAKEAVFIEKSPSCGAVKIFDGTFSDRDHFKQGNGVTSALLKRNGIKITTKKVS